VEVELRELTWHDAVVPPIRIENPLKRAALSFATFTVLIFVGQLLLGEGSILSRLVRALVAGALFGIVVLWMNVRAARRQQSQ
jgi:hypothetical protein